MGAPDTVADLLERMRGLEVVIVGDVMLDRYWWGTVSRLSPEAPVPVVHRQRTTVAPGGAANVAANVHTLGGLPRLVGLVGRDAAAEELRQALAGHGIDPGGLVTDPERPTTVKTRIVAHSQHVVRVDEEDRRSISASVASALEARVVPLLRQGVTVVLSDYAKGCLGVDLLARLIAQARRQGCRIVVDPKGGDYDRYVGASVICPNRSEAFAATGLGADDADATARAGTRLLERVATDAVVITLGEAGLMLFERGRSPVSVVARARAVFDVTGAGDTVIATMALALAAGVSLESAARVANIAAGLAVERVGTTAVTADELRQALLEAHTPHASRRPPTDRA